MDNPTTVHMPTAIRSASKPQRYPISAVPEPRQYPPLIPQIPAEAFHRKGGSKYEDAAASYAERAATEFARIQEKMSKPRQKLS